jgi:hypothetical protein
MRTPEEINSSRLTLEKQLSKLDDEEQAWEALTRPQRIAELLHKQMCKRSHHKWEDNHCEFHDGNWDAPNFAQKKWSTKIDQIVGLLPETYTEEQVLEIVKVAQS